MRDGVYSCWGGFAELGIVSDKVAREADGEYLVKYDYTAQRQNVVPTVRGTPDLAQAVLSISLGETASWLRHAGPLGGKRVCVAGTGIAGLSTALWAKLAGAKAVTVLGRRKVRLDLALDLAADHVVNVKEVDDVAGAVKDLNGGGVDVFCEAVGQKDQLRIGMKCVNPGGTVTIYGVVPEGHYDIDSADFRSNITVMTPSAEEHLAYDWALDMQRRGVIPTEKLMTHQWPLSDYAKAFEQVEKGEVVKGMLVM
jgi:threonine dehydrogenase-like Zn-dependent dehydrogenase